MAMTEDKFCFMDTNILIYASDSHSPWHQPAKEKIKKLLGEGFRLFISPQILREYVSVASQSTGTEKQAPWDMILKNYESFQKHFTLLGEDRDTVNELRQLLSKIPAAGKQVHDANIVATMLAHNIPCLLTNNTDDFSRYSKLITVIPL
jgi:predicted nucleic acid-binding protein